MSRLPQLQLIGKQIGMLEVIELSHCIKNRGYMWRCKCSCGEHVFLSTGALNAGYNKSCGCLLAKNKQQNLQGMQFGNLLVLEQIKISNSRHRYWRCLCKCETEIICTTSELNANRKVSCGCTARRYNKLYKEIWSSLWSRIIWGAQDRKLEFTITIQEAWEHYEKQNRKCALSGLSIYFGDSFTKDETTASLDRIDSSKGYIPGNIQWVHKHINLMKSNYNQEYFIELCKAVAKAQSIN